MRIWIFAGMAYWLIATSAIQGQILEGKVSYTIETSSSNVNLEDVVDMVQGSTMDLYFTPKHARTDLVIGTNLRIVTVIDEEKGEVLTLMNGMIGNKAIRSTLEEADNEVLELSNPTVTLVDEKKQVAGIYCSKAILLDSTEKETEIWYTNEISVSAKGQSLFNDHFPGFPLQFTANKNGVRFIMTANNVTNGLSNSEKNELLNMQIPEEYQELTGED
jgi:hypothetical protein